MAKHQLMLALALAGLSGSAAVAAQQAQTPASTLQNEAQRQQRYYDQQQAPPPKTPVDPLHRPVDSTHAHIAAGAGGHFVLKGVEFTPSALLSKKELDDAVRQDIGTEIDTAGLDRMLDQINALYKAHKITTARALLQHQSIVNGVVHVELVEGRLGKVTIHGNKHVRDGFIRKRIKIASGEVVDSDQLRQDLIYLNRTTDLQARALLEPGQGRGQTDLQVEVQEPERHSLDAFVDDGGVDSTGRYRVGLQGHLYGLLGIDDNLDGNIAHSRGGNDGSLTYSIPVTSNNGRLGVSYAHSQINIIDDAFRNIDIIGTSSVTSLQYTQPFIATPNWLFSGIGSYSLTDATTDISGERIADTHTRSITLGLSLGHQNDGQRWSLTQLASRIHSDEPLLGKSDFSIAPGSASFIQRLGQTQWALRADAGWQFSAGKNSPSANLFQIGGVGSVRGYERGVISGARGYYVDMELHRAFSERLDVFGFVDHGSVYAFYPNDKSITGAGVGAFYHRGWLSASVDVAKPFDTVTPDQDSMRVDFRLTAHWN